MQLFMSQQQIALCVSATEFCHYNKMHLILYDPVAETKIFTKILQYTCIDLLPRHVASMCCCSVSASDFRPLLLNFFVADCDYSQRATGEWQNPCS